MLVLIFLCNFCVASNGAKAERTALIAKVFLAAAVLLAIFVGGYFWIENGKKLEGELADPNVQQEATAAQADTAAKTLAAQKLEKEKAIKDLELQKKLEKIIAKNSQDGFSENFKNALITEIKSFPCHDCLKYVFEDKKFSSCLVYPEINKIVRLLEKLHNAEKLGDLEKKMKENSGEAYSFYSIFFL